jgi:hypothetical protein
MVQTKCRFKQKTPKTLSWLFIHSIIPSFKIELGAKSIRKMQIGAF